MFFMKSESLFSHLSNLSQLSNISYRQQQTQYLGTQFFNQSLPFRSDQIMTNPTIKMEEIGLGSLQIGSLPYFNPVKKQALNFQPLWTGELRKDVEGTSDNQDEQYEVKVEHQDIAQEKDQSQREFCCIQDTQKSEYKQVVEQNVKAMKNETKNIPKNYGKAIIIFIQKNRHLLQQILDSHQIKYEVLLSRLKNMKKKINTISDLKQMWESYPQSKILRIISNYFLRKHSIPYIYNSRIKTRLCHSKYRRRLQQAVLNPAQFNYIKDY